MNVKTPNGKNNKIFLSIFDINSKKSKKVIKNNFNGLMNSTN